MLHKKILCAVLLGATGLAAHGAEQSCIQRSDENAQLLLQVQATYAPENASQFGVDISPDELIARMIEGGVSIAYAARAFLDPTINLGRLARSSRRPF